VFVWVSEMWDKAMGVEEARERVQYGVKSGEAASSPLYVDATLFWARELLLQAASCMPLRATVAAATAD
jgi:hypothetical protein